MEQKKSPKKILIAVLIAAVVAFLGFIFVVGVIRYIAPGPMPEGYTREHHEYGDILEYAKAIDPDATVSEDYVDLEYNEESTVREWPAVINGIECHVVSYPKLYQEKPNSKNLLTCYVIGSDYSNIVLDMVLEDYPELGTTDATGYSHDFKYREYTLDSVYSFVELESIDEETYDSLWDSYVKASEDYARYDPTKPYMLTLVLPDNNTYYISDTDDGTYIEFKEKVFG